MGFETGVLKETRGAQPSTVKKNQSEPRLKKAETVTKLNRFDDPEDVILKNKLETRRMQHFVKDVNHKIKVGPVDANTKIRTPITGFAALP
jgi:hypothetical protein